MASDTTLHNKQYPINKLDVLLHLHSGDNRCFNANKPNILVYVTHMGQQKSCGSSPCCILSEH